MTGGGRRRLGTGGTRGQRRSQMGAGAPSGVVSSWHHPHGSRRRGVAGRAATGATPRRGLDADRRGAAADGQRSHDGWGCSCRDGRADVAAATAGAAAAAARGRPPRRQWPPAAGSPRPPRGHRARRASGRPRGRREPALAGPRRPWRWRWKRPRAGRGGGAARRQRDGGAHGRSSGGWDAASATVAAAGERAWVTSLAGGGAKGKTRSVRREEFTSDHATRQGNSGTCSASKQFVNTSPHTSSIVLDLQTMSRCKRLAERAASSEANETPSKTRV